MMDSLWHEEEPDVELPVSLSRASDDAVLFPQVQNFPKDFIAPNAIYRYRCTFKPVVMCAFLCGILMHIYHDGYHEVQTVSLNISGYLHLVLVVLKYVVWPVLSMK